MFLNDGVFRAIQNVGQKVPIWSHRTTARVLCPGTWGLIIMTHPQYHQSKVHLMCVCVYFWMCKSSQQLLTTRVPYLFLITSFISLLFKGKQCIERRLSALQSWKNPSMSSARQQLHHLDWRTQAPCQENERFMSVPAETEALLHRHGFQNMIVVWTL